MKKIIFYSWQSDLPNNSNRGFIQNALQDAINAISSDDSLQLEPVLDRDTLGVAGSPDISATIFNKIAESDLFVADISIIGRLDNGRTVPNPNVLIELGYAINSLGFDRIILVYNIAYGQISDLPFDLRTRRITTYSMLSDAGEKAVPKKALTRTLQDALLIALKLESKKEQESKIFDSSIQEIEDQKPGRKRKVRQELKQFLDILDASCPPKFSQGGTVDNLIEAIKKAVSPLSSFARLCEIAAIISDEEIVLEISDWFGNIFERFDSPEGYQGPFRDEDFDYYKFIGQELYTILIACLLKEDKWPIIQLLVKRLIPVKFVRHENRGPGNIKLMGMAPFVRSLHNESPNRSRISIHSDLIKDHFNGSLSELLTLDEYMNADLLLFLVVEIAPDKPHPFYSWRPMSLLYLRHVPNIFLKAHKISYAITLANTCGLNNVDLFKERCIKRLDRINEIFGYQIRIWPFTAEDINKIATTRD